MAGYYPNSDCSAAAVFWDRLLKEYSDKTVFRDMDSIPLGFDFRQHIDKLISECSVCVVVIGNRWLTVTDKTG